MVVVTVVVVEVAPAELESVLLRHDSVLDAAVVSLPDERAGELPTAFVVLKPTTTATPQQLQHFVAGNWPVVACCPQIGWNGLLDL